MENTEYADFLGTLDTAGQNFVKEINQFLLDQNCRREVKTAKSGYTVSYLPEQTKKVLATFVCRKTGVKLRIYAQNISRYEGLLDTLPDKMKKDIKKSSVCKRLINPDDCNQKCGMGYDFHMDGEQYKKCRYMAFMPSLSLENNPFIKTFLEKELSFL